MCINSTPIFLAVFTLVDPVRSNFTATIRRRFGPVEADKIAAYFLNLWYTRRIWYIFKNQK
jgi:hypothetical protein